MRIGIIQKGIQEEWHFVIGNGAGDAEEFYEELENQLAPQIEALNLTSGYTKIGNIFSKKEMHYVKFGNYLSLTGAEPFGLDLNITWYLYFRRAEITSVGHGMALTMSDIMGHFTGRTRDKVIAFGTIGKDSAERATKAILSKREEKEKEQSGNLVKA